VPSDQYILSDAKFTINSSEELYESFHDGVETTCKTDDIELKSGVAITILKVENFYIKLKVKFLSI
jgi:hypothetical protein